MTAPHILVVDDEPDIRGLVCEILEDEGFVVSVASDGGEARQARLDQRPDLVLLDIWMPDVDGITLLKEWGQNEEMSAPVIIMSGHGTVETAVEATRLGAYDFLEKPLSLAKLLLTVHHALEDSRLRRENQNLRRHLHSLTRPLGKSGVMVALRQQAERVAAADARVLICGEPGVGRQLLARYIHQNSPRREAPFIELGVASITAENAARELFGEEVEGKIHYGRLEQAHGGTLYLNEVADMDLDTQGRLFSALQSQSVVRVGGATQVKIDVRVMASTRKDIQEAVAKGRFREDLFYALNVVPITVPPLRQRAADIPELLTYYLNYFADNEGLGYRSFSVAAQNRLRQHSWPGNVRELKNLVQRLLILGTDEEIGLDEVELCLGAAPVAGDGEAGAVLPCFDQPLRAAREQFERAYLEYHLREARGNITHLAKAAGMERTHLYRKMKALGINPKDDPF